MLGEIIASKMSVSPCDIDQGYSWVILVATTIAFSFEAMPTPGILYMAFLETYDRGRCILSKGIRPHFLDNSVRFSADSRKKGAD